MADDIRQSLEFNAVQALEELARLDKAFSSFGTQLDAVASQINTFNTAADRVVMSLKSMSQQADATLASFAKLGSVGVPGLGAGAGVAAGTGAQAQMNDVTREAARVFEQTRTPMERYQNQVASLNAMVQQGAITQDTHTRALEQAQTKLKETDKAIGGLTISWQTLARVVVTQLLVRAISMVRDAMKESVEGFLAFSKQISEIHAIDPSRTFQAIATEVRSLSDAFNQPISKVAQAEYQTLSAQFTSTTERLDILTAANALAKVTQQDLVTTTNLLTGALNAYGESSEMAGLRAAQFEKTMELGRIGGDNLAAILGRTTTVAHELGISMEELDAAIATMTVGGVKAAEAGTQLRSIMAALLKPSQDMKKALTEIGVESGPVAIQTWGLVGAVQQLIATTDGTANSISKLFPNLRAMPAAFRLAGEGAEIFQKNLEKIHAIDVATLGKKLADFAATDAERFTAEMNKISNYFKTEFGKDIIHSLSGLTDLFGGSLIPIIRIFVGELKSIGAAAAGLVLVGGYFLYMKMQAWGAGVAVSGLRGAITALMLIPVAQSVGAIIGNYFDQRLSASQKAIRAEAALEEKAETAKTAAAIREADRKNTELIKGLRQYLTGAMKIYLQDADNFKAAMDIQIKVADEAMKRIMQERQRMTHELYSAADKAAQKAADSQFEITKLQAERETRFMEARGATPAEYVARAREAAATAARLQATAKDPEQEKRAQLEWDRAYAMAKQGALIATQTSDTKQQYSADLLLNDIDWQRVNALQAQSGMLTKLSQQLEERARQATEHNFQLEEQRLAIMDKFAQTIKDVGGKLRQKTGAEVEADLEAADKLIERFTTDLKKYAKEDFAKAFMGDPRAFSQLRREAERQFAGINIQTLQATPDAIRALNEQLQAGIKAVRLEAPVIAQIEKVTGLDVLADGLAAVVDTYEKKLSEATAHALTRVSIEKQLEGRQYEGTQGAKAFSDLIYKSRAGQEALTAKYEPIQAATGWLIGTAEYMKKLNQQTTITEDEFTRLQALFEKVPEKARTAFGRFVAPEVIESMSTMYEAVGKRKELLDKKIALDQEAAKDASKAETDAIQHGISALGKEKILQEGATQAAEGGEKAAEGVVDAINQQAINVLRCIPYVADLADQWRGVQTAAAAVATTSAKAGGGGGGGGGWAGIVPIEEFNFALGGLVRHFDRGGFASRGTDTVPAMLSPNEFVMNAQATKKFYGQLVAMNSDRVPNFLAQGGPVANVTVGDIHVNGAHEPRQTAREVIKSLRRELRRGVSVL